MVKGLHASILPGCMCPWTPRIKRINDAVEAEREACAKIAEAWDKENNLSNYGAFIALQIRARGTT
jgi:hypothetical protein